MLLQKSVDINVHMYSITYLASRELVKDRDKIGRETHRVIGSSCRINSVVDYGRHSDLCVATKSH